jgi:hypothetical protein
MPQQSDAAVFQEKLLRLSAGDVADGDFADAVYTAVTSFGLGEQEIRDAFGLTAGAVDRWMQGKNLPQPAIRGKILVWISRRIT